MSVDKSLKSRTTLTRPRSVLSRIERLEKLEDQGRWQEGNSVFGLPKVRTFRPKRRKKVAKPEEEAAAAEATAATPEGSSED